MLLDLLSGQGGLAISQGVSIDFLLDKICEMCSGKFVRTEGLPLGKVISNMVNLCLNPEPTSRLTMHEVAEVLTIVITEMYEVSS